jgi:cyanophycinase
VGPREELVEAAQLMLIRRLLLVLSFAACGEATTTAPATNAPDASETDASAPATPLDGGDGGAPSDTDADLPLSITVYPRLGDPADDTVTPAGPGLLLMGGGPDIDAAFAWARDTIAPGQSGRIGDLVVLLAGGDNSYAGALYARLPFRSAQTIVIPPGASPHDLAVAGAIVSRAEYVWYGGGQQSAYAVWAGSALAAAVQGVYDRGGIVGGTSAGALVMGAFVFDALTAGISENVTSAVGLADPFDPKISFTRHMFAFPPFADAITDVHFEERDRLGRLVTFMARQHTDGAIVRTPPSVLGIGIDEDAALVVDAKGVGRLIPRTPSGRIFLVRGGPPAVATAGQRLDYPALEVHRLDDPTQVFDFTRWCGTAPVYTLDLAADAGFGAAPYDRPGVSSPCP